MEFLNNSKNYSLNRKTYINLRWIAIIGQFAAINLATFVFNYEFSFIKSNLVILIGAISNIYLMMLLGITMITYSFTNFYLRKSQ